MNRMKIEEILNKIGEKCASFDASMANRAVKYLEQVKAKIVAEIDAEINKLKAKAGAPAATTTTSTQPTGFNAANYRWSTKEGYAPKTTYSLRLERIEEDGQQIKFFFYDPTTGKRIYAQRMSNNPTTERAKKVWCFDLKWIANIHAFGYTLAALVKAHRALYNKDYNKTVRVQFDGRNVMFVG